jgi:hypothetical protein
MCIISFTFCHVFPLIYQCNSQFLHRSSFFFCLKFWNVPRDHVRVHKVCMSLWDSGIISSFLCNGFCAEEGGTGLSKSRAYVHVLFAFSSVYFTAPFPLTISLPRTVFMTTLLSVFFNFYKFRVFSYISILSSSSVENSWHSIHLNRK